MLLRFRSCHFSFALPSATIKRGAYLFLEFQILYFLRVESKAQLRDRKRVHIVSSGLVRFGCETTRRLPFGDQTSFDRNNSSTLLRLQSREAANYNRRMSENHQANYGRVWMTFMRNALVREMTFRGNFLINLVTRAFWFAAQITLFEIIYRNVDSINDWSRYQYFAFMATGMLINAIIEGFFMPNCANFSELIRTGNLDFALLKPIDTQFLVSCEKIELAMINQIALSCGLLGYSLYQIGEPISVMQAAAFLVYVLVGVAFFYSLMISLASTSIWLGRNQGLYDFWFYVTVFARYPRSIYRGVDSNRIEAGDVLQTAFTYVLPILLVVTVPAQVITNSLDSWVFPFVALVSSLAGLVVSRFVFLTSLKSYRSASS